MITMHSVSAAYVKARQAEEQQEPKPLDPHASYEPHCLERWADSVAGADDQAQFAEPEVKE